MNGKKYYFCCIMKQEQVVLQIYTRHDMISKEEIQHKAEKVAVVIITRIMEDWDMGMKDAIGMYYESDTFELVLDPDAGLYDQHADFIYEIFNSELRYGKIRDDMMERIRNCKPL